MGGGPFPTEQDNDIGQHIRERGNEYGTVTGRPRRCGWFDAVAARYTARLCGVDALAVMLLDVLSELPELKICTAYELDGRRTRDFPGHVGRSAARGAGLRDDARLADRISRESGGWRTFRRQRPEYLDRLSESAGPAGRDRIGWAGPRANDVRVKDETEAAKDE